MHIRSETPADYGAVADIHIQAFGYRSDEASIVALLRQRHAYDPDLSLLAVQDGIIAGHALFTPVQIRLLDADVPAVVLAPLAVAPDFQKSGVGAALMEAGHATAREKGYTLAFLLGHPTYYPRFGYRTHAFGGSSLEIDTAPYAGATELETRFPLPEDLPALLALWELEEGGVDFSMRPAQALYDWYAPIPAVTALVYRKDGEVVGYSRASSEQIKMFLARDDETAAAMVNHLAKGQPRITLPLHPHSRSAAAFGKAESAAWDAGMALALGDVPLEAYFKAIRSGKRAPGRPIWGTAFDLA